MRNGDFEYEEFRKWSRNNDNEYTICAEITGYYGSGTVVKIPALINGLKVIDVQNGSFRDKAVSEIIVEEGSEYLSSKDGVLFNKQGDVLIYCLENKSGIYTVPDGVRTIYFGAFAGCTKLTSVILPSTLALIRMGAFQCCEFSSITLPEGLKEIESLSFECCKLIEINIPASVDCIDTDAFRYCDKLTAINVHKDNQQFASLDGVLFTKDMRYIVQYPSGKTDAVYIVPDSVRDVTDYTTFVDAMFTSIVLPSSWESCRGDSICDCPNLLSIEISPDNPEFTSIDGVLFNKNITKLIKCPDKKSGVYHVPDGVTTIGDWAFANCKGLTSVIIPQSVTKIEYCAFISCGLSEADLADIRARFGSVVDELRTFVSIETKRTGGA